MTVDKIFGWAVGIGVFMYMMGWYPSANTTTRQITNQIEVLSGHTIPAVTKDRINFGSMIADTSCASHYSDDKKSDLFDAKYKDAPITITGTIVENSAGKVSLKVLPNTFTWDVEVTFKDTQVAYDLRQGQRITVDAIMRSQGGCFLSYGADEGVIS